MCVRPHRCFGCIIINDNNIIGDSNDETCIEGIGSCVPRPDNIHKGCIIGDGALVYSGLMSNIGYEYEDDISKIDDALGITTVDDNNKKLNTEEAKDICTKLYSCISIWKGEAHCIPNLLILYTNGVAE